MEYILPESRIFSLWMTALFSQKRGKEGIRSPEILDIYSRGSRQMINREKSAIFFSKNCSHEMKEVVRVLDIHKEALVEKYLGLPTEVCYVEYLSTYVLK